MTEKPSVNLAQRQASNSLARHFAEYISAGWDTLTRTMSRCDSLEDTKTGGEAIAYAFNRTDGCSARDCQSCKTIAACRVDHLPTKITRPGEIDSNKIPAEGAETCTWKIPTLCLGAN